MMASEDTGFDVSDGFGLQRPSFHIGYHNSNSDEPLTDLQYGHLLNHGVSRILATSMDSDSRWKRSVSRDPRPSGSPN